MHQRQIHAPGSNAELTRLRLTVAKVRGVYESLREREAHYQSAVDAPKDILKAVSRTYHVAANTLEDALIDADYEAFDADYEAAADTESRQLPPGTQGSR